MQLRAMQKSNACPTHNQCKTLRYLHQGYKIQQGHKCVVLKIMQQNLEVLKKLLQSKDIKESTEYKLKVLNQST